MYATMSSRIKEVKDDEPRFNYHPNSNNIWVHYHGLASLCFTVEEWETFLQKANEFEWGANDNHSKAVE